MRRRDVAGWVWRSRRGVTEISTQYSVNDRVVQCTLTVSSWWLMALAMATSRLSVSMIGVPSAACSAKSFSPGWISGTFGNSAGTSSERIAQLAIRFCGSRLHVGDLPVAEMGKIFDRYFDTFHFHSPRFTVHHLLDEAQTERAFRDQVARGLAENCRVL
jgi:hypothetical protein